MEDFQSKYNGKQIDQLLDKANDIDLTKYALKTDNAPTATKLQAARTIALSGAVTGSVSSDFGGNVTISTTLANFDASKIASGTISIDRLPKAALERLVVVADDTARFALTTATAQSGDTVKVTSTGKMYLIKDESKLNSEDGYEPYTASQASSVPWSGVTGKPSTFTPPTSSATVLGGIKVGYTTSGKNYKVQLDSSGNAYVNVPWTDTNTTYTNMGAASASAAGAGTNPAAPAAEVVRSDSPNASVQKTGGNVTITGKSNSTKLTFAVTPAEENGLTLQLPANYTAAGKTTANGAVIADDPGAAGEFVWSITISDVPANVTIEELTATLKVTAAGGQIANVTVTQAAGDSTIELDKETINLDVNGTQQTVNVTSNDSWTWAQAAARTVLRMMGR